MDEASELEWAISAVTAVDKAKSSYPQPVWMPSYGPIHELTREQQDEIYARVEQAMARLLRKSDRIMEDIHALRGDPEILF